MYQLFLVFRVSAHGTAKVVSEVKSLEGFETALVKHVRAIQKVNLSVLVMLVGVVTDGTI